MKMHKAPARGSPPGVFLAQCVFDAGSPVKKQRIRYNIKYIYFFKKHLSFPISLIFHLSDDIILFPVLLLNNSGA